MKLRLSPFVVLAAGVCLLPGAFTQSAFAFNPQPDPPAFQDVTGQWFGFFQPSEVPPGPCKLTLTVGLNHHFDGTLAVSSETPGSFATTGSVAAPIIVINSFPIKGAIAASDRAVFNGEGDAGTVVSGVKFFDSGGGAAIFDGSLTERMTSGVKQHGRLSLLRYFTAPLAPDTVPNVAATWHGEAVSDRNSIRTMIDASFAADPDLQTGFNGTVTWGTVPPGPCRGSINAEGQVVLIAPEADRLLVLTATYSASPNTITGRYKLTRSNGVHDQGTFVIAVGASGG